MDAAMCQWHVCVYSAQTDGNAFQCIQFYTVSVIVLCDRISIIYLTCVSTHLILCINDNYVGQNEIKTVLASNGGVELGMEGRAAGGNDLRYSDKTGEVFKSCHYTYMYLIMCC